MSNGKMLTMEAYMILMMIIMIMSGDANDGKWGISKRLLQWG